MRCYFYGEVKGADQLAKQPGIVSFAVPDFGIIFRSRWEGNLIECQYAALLSLLQFIETNEKLFKGKNIEIYSDASVVIYQLTKGTFIFKQIESYYRLVQVYKNKFTLNFRWIPEQDNPAHHGLFGTPPIKPTVEINYSIKKSENNSGRVGGVLPM